MNISLVVNAWQVEGQTSPFVGPWLHPTISPGAASVHLQGQVITAADTAPGFLTSDKSALDSLTVLVSRVILGSHYR